MNDVFVNAIVSGSVDERVADLATTIHPEWAGTCDLLGIQYYNRVRVVGTPGVALDFVPCDDGLRDAIGVDPRALGCPIVDARDLTTNGREHYPEGLREVLRAVHQKYPALPLRITENGIPTRSGRRRSESIVRHLAAVHAAIEEGIPVDGYIHWSLLDNFEWGDGYTQRFGLFEVDRATMERIPTEAVGVYAGIAATNTVSGALLDTLGPGHPMSPEE
jgi:beta-glucosidase/6-phospho-beta-glucosidase/beta-galactosidase